MYELKTSVEFEVKQEISPKWEIAENHSISQRKDLLALPELIEELPKWIETPLRRYLRLKKRNWPAKTVQRSTRQLFNRLNKMITFFIQNYNWSAWQQLSPDWIEGYIDFRIREGIAPSTINWDLINLRVFCQFVMDEGYPISTSILKLKLLERPRSLPRPLSKEEVLLLEKSIQKGVLEAKNRYKLSLAMRDLTCWHCGLRISEVCSLFITDLDIPSRKIFISNSKERKDRIVYISYAVVNTLEEYLAIREDQESKALFVTKGGNSMTTRTLQRRLVYYGKQCEVPVTAHRLRHTFASQILEAGMSVTSLQRLLGHENLDTTMLYTKVTDPMLQ